MKNSIEIERRFLLLPCSVKKFLKKKHIIYSRESIEQVYIKSDELGAERFRRAGNRYIHTIKTGSGLQRQEIEEYVSYKEYQDAKLKNPNIIKKIRCRFELDGYEFELDIFKDRLKGLNILEIEFDDLNSAKSFKMPDVLSQIVISEVTDDRRFTNGYLSKSMTIPKPGR